MPRQRSRSAVRFVDQAAHVDQLHSLHQSLRDLSSGQIRLEEDLSRELSRRNRTETETKRVLEELTGRLGDPQRQESVSDRVERRLQAMEREIHAERQMVERRQDQLGHMSVHLQEALKQQDAKANEVEIILKNKLLRTEDEKSKLEQELEHSRRKLDQSEYSREALLHQIEDLRSQLLRAEEERQSLQHQISQVAFHHQRRSDEQEDGRRKHRVADQNKEDLEKQIWELRAKLSHSAVMSEIEELKRCIERKDKEKAQLGLKIEVLTSDLEKRENQQQQMLSQLKEIQSNYQACENDCRAAEHQVAELSQQLEESVKEAERCLAELRQSEALRQDGEKKKEEFKLKAQETIKHWKLKCRKLEQETEKQSEVHAHLTEKNNLILKEKDDLKGQLLSAMHQMENLQKELSDALEKRAKQEEELHCKDRKLSEARSLQLALDQEIRDVRETADKLDSELQRQGLVHNQMSSDKQRLEEELATINTIHEKDQGRLLEMQAVIKNLSAIRAELTHQIAEEEKVKKEIRKNLMELQKQQESKQEEMAVVSKQLKLERDVHQKELAELQSELQWAKTKHDQQVQEMMKRFGQEKEEAADHIGKLKAELSEERNLVKAHRRQVEKMKIECDKLTEELSHKEEDNAKLRRKYQFMKQELDDKDKRINSEEDNVRRVEEERLHLNDQLCCLQSEQESILTVIGSEIDAACEVFSRDSLEKFKAISLMPGVRNDPHRWLAETKTKLQWLCEEAKEKETKEKKLRRLLQQGREQLKHLTFSKESERHVLLSQLEKQEQLLDEVHQAKRDLLEKTLRKEEEISALQERIATLETSTRVALDHLESVPEKLSLLEDFRDFGNCPDWTVGEKYIKYKEIMGSLQQHLEDSKRRLEEFRDKKTEADISPIHSATSNWRTSSNFMSSSLLSTSGSLTRSTLDLNTTKKNALSVTVNGMKPRMEQEEY
ncbi:centrosomal protein of 128 kDa isoform X1 [Sphaerodactylus townsendi]|nr:centrosomal protein of 128 kDa isoform X1 [Sphaerodactylus townsendi]XP_048342481.1 centrosomal protein of 128 kDa isoform X1 [Sphaerodactylus townsendi]